jgi:hypothetical protein
MAPVEPIRIAKAPDNGPIPKSVMMIKAKTRSGIERLIEAKIVTMFAVKFPIRVFRPIRNAAGTESKAAPMVPKNAMPRVMKIESSIKLKSPKSGGNIIENSVEIPSKLFDSAAGVNPIWIATTKNASKVQKVMIAHGFL